MLSVCYIISSSIVIITIIKNKCQEKKTSSQVLQGKNSLRHNDDIIDS